MSNPLEKLAILIPTRNRPGILASSLEQLRKAGLGSVPLWVYDDFSANPNAIRDVVKGWDNGHVIRGEQRVGQAKGRNVLMRACQKEFGFLIDDDSYPMDVAGLSRHLCRTDNKRAITTFQYLDIPTRRYSTPLGVGEGVSRFFQGGGSLFHIPTVLGLGGYSEFFVYGYEEPELSLRIWINGYHIWYDPEVTVHHAHFETPNEQRDDREYDYLYARNSVLMSSLNMPLWFGLPHGLARSVRRSFFRPRNALSKLRGTWDGAVQSLTRGSRDKRCSVAQALAWCRFIKSCPR